ncbi:hypothetical protein BGY98DRAFT_972682 [Russula aff. rugulosa BPL654]|nr:hypothetical protein BGY98DRAFT_972682 [Russula aff. rugulosa BPL654]
MHISKNTAVILNCYGIHHDKERFPDPYAPTQLRLISFNLNADKCAPSHGRFAFNPERFLSDTLTYAESSNLNAMDWDNCAFGAEYIIHSASHHRLTFIRMRHSRRIIAQPSMSCRRKAVESGKRKLR